MAPKRDPEELDKLVIKFKNASISDEFSKVYARAIFTSDIEEGQPCFELSPNIAPWFAEPQQNEDGSFILTRPLLVTSDPAPDSVRTIVQSSEDIGFTLLGREEKKRQSASRGQYHFYYCPSEHYVFFTNESDESTEFFDYLEDGDTEVTVCHPRKSITLQPGTFKFIAEGSPAVLRILPQPKTDLQLPDTPTEQSDMEGFFGTSPTAILERRERLSKRLLIAEDDSSDCQSDAQLPKTRKTNQQDDFTQTFTAGHLVVRLGVNESMLIPPSLMNSLNDRLCPGYTVTNIKRLFNNVKTQVMVAHQSELDRDVVVKITKCKTPGEVVAWKMEERIHESLNHERIPRLLASDSHIAALYMAPIDGVCLRDSVFHDANFLSRMPLGMVLWIVETVAQGLRYLHEVKHIIHGDIKPGSLLFNPTDGASIIDFGTAVESDMKPSTGGTPRFAPPEFQHTNKIGYGRDIWAFGVTLLYFVGRVPAPDLGDRLSDPWDIKDLLDGLDVDDDAFVAYLEWLGEINDHVRALDTDCASLISHHSRLGGNASKLSDHDRQDLVFLFNLVRRMLIRDPEKRITAGQIEAEIRQRGGYRPTEYQVQRWEQLIEKDGSNFDWMTIKPPTPPLRPVVPQRQLLPKPAAD